MLALGLSYAGCEAFSFDIRVFTGNRMCRDAPAAASALAFASPLTPDYPLLGLDREPREPGAFIGYQDTVTESFSIGLTDNQSNDPTQDFYNRWSYSEKVGVRYK